MRIWFGQPRARHSSFVIRHSPLATILSHSIEETSAFGRSIASTLRRGDVLALCGELGAGKTHFVKGVAAGLGAGAIVTSPTFTLIHEYTGGRLPLFHFDFYRLENETEAIGIGLEEYLDGEGACAIEWAEKFPALLPPGTRWFRFTLGAGDARSIEEIPAPSA
jgi:tRNA threonylcarbamoyladenosine biosynthesis protein TsaE